jgi:predicted phosphodiesterase
MVYLILSDIHGNLEAFRAVVDSFPDTAEKRVVCAGDTVGYGANPNECVHLIMSLGAENVLGNHDAAVLGTADIEHFNEYAAQAVLWTRDAIGSKEAEYLKGLPLVSETGPFTVAHGTLHDPEEFLYMMSGADAMRTFEIMRTQVCFVGHSHVPGIFILRGGKIYESSKKKVKLEDGVSYVVNAGSIGQPRDGDERACYCVYDTDKGEIEFRRVDYDLKSAHDAIIRAGLPRMLAERLLTGS